MITVFRKGQHSLSKIVCLALGLAISSVIIAEIYFEQTFDAHFPGADRTYQILERWKTGDMQEASTAQATPGGWAPGLKKYAPIVEAATRATGMWGTGTLVHLDDGKTVASSITLADSCFFDVFPQKILVGNAKEVLSTKLMVMVSDEVAKTIGGNVVGRHFTIDGAPGYTFTIGGVFEAFPWGTSGHGEGMFLSLNTLDFFGYSGADNWVGNDRYSSYIRLAKGHKPEELQPFIRKALADNIDKNVLKKAGTEVGMDIQLINDVHTSDSYVRMMKWILSIIAFVLLFTSVMNYLLIVVSNLVGRSREMAARKCYGAERGNIYGLIFKEAAADVALSVLLALILVSLCKGTVEDFLSAPVTTLIFNRGAWLLVAMILIVLFVAGIIPGWLYNRTPVTVAFRGYNENKHRWKLGLLAAEFAMVGLMLSLLCVISSQYNKMMNLNPGYDYDHVAILCVTGINSDQRKQCLTELERMPQVVAVSSASRLPIDGWFGSGNNVSLPGEDREIFNAEDCYFVGKGFFQLFKIPLLEGSTPQVSAAIPDSDIINGRTLFVDKTFAEKIQTYAGWKDGVVGKRIFVSEHCDDKYPTVTIVGVFRNIQMGGVNHATDGLKRPTMMFYGGDFVMPEMLLKLHDLTPEIMQQIREKAERMFPGKLVSLYSYSTEYGNQYTSQRNFRNGILAGGIVVLVIALFGLVGYTGDEVQRRSKEIAVRKINGATVSDIIQLFIRDIVKIAVPSIIVGDIGAWLIALQWLQSFTVRISLTVVPFVIVTIGLIVLIGISITINCWHIANSNPVKYLKDE